MQEFDFPIKLNGSLKKYICISLPDLNGSVYKIVCVFCQNSKFFFINLHWLLISIDLYLYYELFEIWGQ